MTDKKTTKTEKQREAKKPVSLTGDELENAQGGHRGYIDVTFADIGSALDTNDSENPKRSR